MNLRVGVVGHEPGWEQLLRREGIPYVSADPPYPLTAYAVLVVGDGARREHVPAVRTFVNDGGSVLASSKQAAVLAGLLDKSVRVSTFLPCAEPEFASVGMLDVFGTVGIPERANTLQMFSGEKAAFFGRQGNGHVLILPFDAPRLISDERARTKSFYAPAARLPFERVSAVSKGEARTFVARCLELLYHRRGLPFAHVWYYPDGARTLFAFRVDTDASDEADVRRLSDLAHEERVPMTWFVHVEQQRTFLRVFREMRDQEIGIHCYEHRTFTERPRILADLRKAQEALMQAGITPSGYAAPYGVWSRPLGEAIAEMRFDYSSEFSYAYDDVPLSPALGGGVAGVLQVPVHPVCLGTMRRHRYSTEQADAYFDMVLRRAVRTGIPAFFYHHPLDGHPDVLRTMFTRVREAGVPMVTMGRFAAWWNARMQSAVQAEFVNGAVLTRGSGHADIRVRISTPNGRQAFVRLEGECSLAGGGWEAIPDAVPYPKDLIRARRFNHRIPLVKGLDAVTGLFKRKD